MNLSCNNHRNVYFIMIIHRTTDIQRLKIKIKCIPDFNTLLFFIINCNLALREKG